MLFALILAVQAPAPPQLIAPGERPAAATLVVEPIGMFLAACDSDGDARTTRAEADACVARSFATIAKGAASLGYIGFADWAGLWLGDRTALPGPFEVDRDGDNRITLGELQARIAAISARIDRNNDGVLTRTELLTIRTMPGGDRPGRRGR
jgi:hypothetical protein